MALTSAPTVYQYYTSNGINAGLSDSKPYFTLNNKNVTIYSGAFHYFRVPRAYWRDRLKQMRAAGLNTVETYIPWNLHEPHSGVYDFGNGGSEMEDFLHLEEFLKTAKEEDLLVLIRTGPYMNSEWEFGGLPSWLTKYAKTMRNSKDAAFLTYVKRWFNVLLPLLAVLQFQKGGPIVGFQIENEYGNTGRIDPTYLKALQNTFISHGISELLYTCDRPVTQKTGHIPGVLMTANFKSNVKSNLDTLRAAQPGKPTMVMEYWTGWFDHWLDAHHNTVRPSQFIQVLEEIIDYPASLNMYMFVGGTDFYFTNGATMSSRNHSDYKPLTTSYDYDAPITEYGDYTLKYTLLRNVLINKTNVYNIPAQPAAKNVISYNALSAIGQLSLGDTITKFEGMLTSEKPIPMEELSINNNSGQSFGYIAYRKTGLRIPAGAVLKITGYVRDTLLVLINGKLVSPVPTKASDIDGFGFWRTQDQTLVLTQELLHGATLDLVVENFGRNTLGVNVPKGVTGDVFINSDKITNWQIAPLEFKKSWNSALAGFKTVTNRKNAAYLYIFTLSITGTPSDTYLDMREWTKGIVIVNGFVIGRYFFLGPQQSLYLPAPFLTSGHNHIIVFEHYNAPETLKFSSTPIYSVPKL